VTLLAAGRHAAHVRRRVGGIDPMPWSSVVRDSGV
jgi:hypothetical protein